MNFKKRALTFVYLLILLIILAVAAIYIIDPYQIYHKSFFWKDKAHSKTIFQDAGIINNYDFDSVIIGSSMLENIDARDASKRIDGEFVNLSVSDSDFYERAIVLRKALKKNLKHVIYSMDEHIYLYPRYGHPKRPVDSYGFLYDENIFNDYKVYLNRDFVRLSLNPPTNSIYLPNPWITDKQTSVRFGGWKNWIINPAPSWEKDFIPIRLPLSAKDSIYNKRKLGKPFKLARTKKEYIKAHIFLMAKKNRDTTFHLIFPPYYRYVHANERQNDQNKFLQYQAAIRYVVTRTKKHKNIKVYGFDDMDFTSDIVNYTDLTHFKPEYNLLMLDAISSQTHLLTPDNLEDYLSRTEKLFYDFDLVKLNNEVQEIVKEVEG